MFEKEIKFIADFNLNKIKNLGSFITFERLSNSEIHPSIIQYISAELDYLINEDRKKLLQQSLFDYAGAEVSRYFNLIAQEIKKTKKIAYEDLKKLVIQAVSFNINYIVRPKWSLSKLVYNDSDSKPIDEIKLLMNYVYYYDYIKDIFNSYLSKRKLFSLSVTEFDSILSKIDKELFSSQSQKLVDNTLFTIAEFFNVGGVNKIKISPVTIELFLKEKNLIDYLFRLRKVVAHDSKQRLDIDEIRKILYSSVPINKDEIIFEEEITETEFDNKVTPENKIKLEVEDEISIQKEPEAMEEESNLFSDSKFENENSIENISSEIGEPENIDEEIIEEEDNFLDKDLEIDTTIDEDILSLYDEKLDLGDERNEKSSSKLDDNDLKNSSDKELDSLYDFEEESSELLKDFSISEEEIEKADFESELSESSDLLSDEINEEKNFKDILLEEEKTIGYKVNKKEVKPDSNEKEGKSFRKTEKLRKKNKDIFNFLSSKDIEKIVSSVFNDDREDFANTLEKLNECSSYDEATEILKSVFLTYRINPYSRDAVNLTNAVSNYFEQV